MIDILAEICEYKREHIIRQRRERSEDSLLRDAKDMPPPRPFHDNLKSKGNSRLFLHARYLKFRHPLSGDFVEIQAPLPKDLTALLEKLG